MAKADPAAIADLVLILWNRIEALVKSPVAHADEWSGAT